MAEAKHDALCQDRDPARRVEGRVPLEARLRRKTAAGAAINPGAGTATSASDRALLEHHGRFLLDSARASISHGLEFGRPLPLNPASAPPELLAKRATHVVLQLGPGGPRRRAGDVRPWRALVDDVVGNAFSAAFADRRHAPLKPEDRFQLAITIMLLGEPQPIASPAQVRAGSDGVLAEWPDGRHHALFPDSWAFHNSPEDFLDEVLRRSRGKKREAARLYRFSVATVADS